MKVLLVILASVFLVSFSSPIDKASWLLGTWKGTSPIGTITESWEKKNDTLFVGDDYLINEGDTIFSEHLEIKQRGDDVYYIARVADQNGGKPVEFKLTSSTKESLVFENPTHDFPQKITYTQSGKNALVAEVSGTEKGVARSEKFELKKVK